MVYTPTSHTHTRHILVVGRIVVIRRRIKLLTTVIIKLKKKNSSVYNIAFHLGPATAGTRRAVFTSTYAIYNNTLDAQCCRLQWHYIYIYIVYRYMYM